MKTWKIPVTWEMCGVVEVEADTFEEAMNIAEDETSNIALPDGDYVDGSWNLSYTEENFIRECYNDNQPDEGQVTRFYVCGIGYDKYNIVTDYDLEFGDFDTYEEAYNCFVKMQCKDFTDIFADAPDNVHYIVIQLEECIEENNYIGCVEIHNEDEKCREDYPACK